MLFNNFRKGDFDIMIKEDARIVKTKRKLLSTFRTLIKEKSFEDITVNEICEAANVRRATFYKHFPDKLAFLKFFISSLRSLFEKGIARHKKYDSDYEYYVDYLTATVRFLDDNEDIVSKAMASNMIPVLLDVIMKHNYEDTCARLHESVKAGMVLRASVEVTAAMIIGAVAEAILNWYVGGKIKPVEQFIDEMTSVLIGMMK
jgi:AcrR family transcriptional regulator